MAGLDGTDASARLAAALLTVWERPGTGSPSRPARPSCAREDPSVLRSLTRFLPPEAGDPLTLLPDPGLEVGHLGVPDDRALARREASRAGGEVSVLGRPRWRDLAVPLDPGPVSRMAAQRLGRLVRLCGARRVILALRDDGARRADVQASLAPASWELYRTVATAMGADVCLLALPPLGGGRPDREALAGLRTILQWAREPV